MSDYPDFHRRIVNLYGIARQFSSNKICGAGVTTPLGTVTGVGTTYGGFISSYLSSGLKGDTPLVLVDGATLLNYTWEEFYNLGITISIEQPFILSSYDEINGYFTGLIMPDITFNKSIELKYINSGGVAVTVKFAIYYGLVV